MTTPRGEEGASRRRARRRVWLLPAAGLAALALLTALGGCAGLGVEPWQRDVLAQPGMQLRDDPVRVALDEHIYFSKEASTGGASFGGGGCGCN